MFYIKAENLKERQALLAYLTKRGIGAVFHYVPLHSSDGGIKYGYFSGKDKYTTAESERLIRLPMWYGLDDEVIKTISTAIRTCIAGFGAIE